MIEKSNNNKEINDKEQKLQIYCVNINVYKKKI